MPLRNLTYNQGQDLSSSSNDGLRSEASTPSDEDRNDSHSYSDQNPFLASEEKEADRHRGRAIIDSSSSSSIQYGNRENSESSLIPGNTGQNMNQRTSDYKGYYSRAGRGSAGGAAAASRDNSRLGPSKALPSSTSLNTGLSANDIMSPPEYDRYPLVSSRVTSMAQMHNAAHAQAPPVSASSSTGNVSNSSISSNPFLGEQDFSPFGGYPATSFPLLMDEKEEDDYLHNPDPEEEARLDRRRFVDDFKHMSKRSAGGLIGILVVLLGAMAVFIILPALTFTGATHHTKPEVVEFLTEYEYPQLSAIRTNLVDPNTPSTAMSRQAMDGSYWQLTFSDEFNEVGRTFYDGDDQFWTAPDFHYAATHDLEWYTPDAVTTSNGTLQFRMDAFKNHDLYYRSGMVQSWNKLCFSQGILEISANLPNYGRVLGLWPGMWTLGNLARPGFLATSEGVWPYSYDSCDAGITPNQSSPDGISYLPGQRLSVCTCDGEDHPNQGTGRGAPEIDVLEGSTDTTLGVGVASQSYQVAPYDIWYIPDYEFIEIYNFTTTSMNTYCGGPFQQAVSAITTLNTSWYEFGPGSGRFQKYAYEFLSDDDDGYIRWFVGDVPTFTLYATALHPDGNINWRRIAKEPMSIIMNLGISNNWAYIDWQFIFFPVTMSIDYVRIYQPNDSVQMSCDPPTHPTYDYIEAHKNAYTNNNLTSWEAAGYTTPKNILTGNCKSSKFKLSS